jgi:hypothetical protein
VGHQLVQFFERAFVQQQFHALPRRKLTLSMLPLAPLGSSALFRCPVPPP